MKSISQADAKDICTKPEFELVSASFPPAINELSPARLRQQIVRARKLQDKYRDQSRSQHRTVKGGTHTPREQASNQRTEKKGQLFIETRERFEEKLDASS
jgi:hypothetical protein